MFLISLPLRQFFVTSVPGLFLLFRLFLFNYLPAEFVSGWVHLPPLSVTISRPQGENAAADPVEVLVLASDDQRLTAVNLP